MWNGKRISAAEKRISELETRLSRITDENADGYFDQVLKRLGQRLVVNNPQDSYINQRFRAYELAILNVKQLGYELGRRLAESNLRKQVRSAPSTILKSSLCTQADIESDWFSFWCHEIRSAPIYHRKLWELCYISQVLWSLGKLKSGMSGLGFGCGNEPLPSLFAKYGASVLATDLDSSRPEAKGWSETNQHAQSAENFWNRDICPDDQRLSQISFQPLDMNEIPRDLDARFDFCWSACAFEHVGSIEKGLKFVEESLKTLKPGGVAVHTTEFNLQDGETIDNWGTVLFQKQHLIDFSARLTSLGFQVAPLDFNPGDRVLDGFVDIPPWEHEPLRSTGEAPHLKLSVDGFPCTSVGLIVQVPSNRNRG